MVGPDQDHVNVYIGGKLVRNRHKFS